MFDIITFGSATRDTFLRLKKENYQIWEERGFPEGKALCFPFGSKIFIEDLEVATGGGGTNSACTFSNQGFKVTYVGKVGDDKRGEAVIEDLKRFKIPTPFVKKDKNYPTAYSAILSSPQGDRTILLYRGACHFLKREEIPFNKLKTDWFYLAPLSGESSKVFGPLVTFAKENNIKVAVNLGNSQIDLGEDILKPILEKLDILILNGEEAALLTRLPQEEEREIIKKLASVFTGILIITKGKEGSVVFDGRYIFEAGSPKLLPFEKTGAGDAYGAGFLSGFLEKNDVKYAIQLATANATSCIQKIGAKNGLLKKGQWGSWPLVKVEKNILL
ncbi:carbohydrate kinase family protein [Patescibacteria group bacterium]|nr:carbohydrate kinase family protein [Patescibacteria group bacterium]